MAGRRLPRESPAAKRERLGRVDDLQVALDAALRFLEARQRSTDEVRRRLTRAGYRAELIDAAIERLTGLGIVDDELFARSWVESRDRARPRGERALQYELRRKGLTAEVIAATLDERREATDVEAGEPSPDDIAAERLLARHARALARITDPRVRRQRAYALLARNGFDPEIAGRLASATARPVVSSELAPQTDEATEPS